MKVWLFLIGLFLILPTGSILAADVPVDPSKDMRCWTKQVCSVDANHDNIADGRFDDSSDEAKKACGGSYGFCYPPAMEYTLGVSLPIGDRIETSVTDLGDYIDKAYKFMLGFATLFAVLMLMVGGMQYISSPGGEEISKAKERIMNSLIGLVLLMCAALILFTVNPHLINLEMPSIPKSRTVFFISDSTTCELLLDKGYTLKNSSGQEMKNEDSSVVNGKCGDELMTVVKDPLGQSIEKTTSCQWSTCTEQNTECLSATTKDSTSNCLNCKQVTADNTFGVKPSSATCSRLTPKDTTNINYECFLTDETSMTGLSNSCVLLEINCDLITKCEDYAKILVKNDEVVAFLAKLKSSSGSDLDLKTVCEQDVSICNIGEKTGGKCQFELTTSMATLDNCKTVSP